MNPETYIWTGFALMTPIWLYLRLIDRGDGDAEAEGCLLAMGIVFWPVAVVIGAVMLLTFLIRLVRVVMKGDS